MSDNETAKYLTELISQDPGLPRSKPTESYWQRVPHALSTIQNLSLPTTTEVPVIGTGITGASVAKTILEGHPSVHVTLFEARALCSGATGRNGDQLAINAVETYLEMKKELGAQVAGEILHFNLKTLDRLREVALEVWASEEAEITDVVKLRSFKDASGLERVKAGVEALETDHPSLSGIYKILDAQAYEKVREYESVRNMSALFQTNL